MRWKLFWAIFGVAAGVLILVLGVAVGGLNTVRERATRSELQRAGTVLAEVVADHISEDATLAELVRSGTIDRLAPELSVIRRAAGSNEVVFFAVSAEGRVIGRPEARALDLDVDGLRQGQSQFLTTTSGNREVWVFAQPVGDVGAREMTVVALLTRAAPVDVQIPGGWLLATLVGVAVLAAVVASLLSRNLVGRMKALMSAAKSVSEGDLSARAEVSGSDELTTVAAAFNEMAAGLEESRDRERQFLLSVGHDLRTPLTTIAGYAEALEDGLDDPGEVARIAGVLGIESGRLRRLIEDVMLLARVESAEFGLRPEPVDVAAHVEGLLAGFGDRAREARITLVRNLDDVGTRIVDPDRLGQVTANLVENALRYTPETGRVEISLRAGDGDITLEVSDTGPGIEADDLPHIFDRFYVARRYRGIRPEGSGLGLSIVQHLAKAMGGRATADSVPGSGTTIRVDLPAPLTS